MIVIVDFGSQTAHLIGRRVRQLGVAVEYVDPENALQTIKEKEPKGIIFSGGPADVFEKGAPNVDPEVLNLGIPILGICYGEQLVVHLLGGRVESGKAKEYGPAILETNAPSPLLSGIADNHFRVWMSHGNDVTRIPKGFSYVAGTKKVRAAMIQDLSRKIFCVLFHPEVKHTVKGVVVLRNFVEKVCEETVSRMTLSPGAIVDSIRQTVGNKKVLCAVSGGVDSTVAAYLIGKAVGTGLVPVYVDSGLMRPGTRERVRHIFTSLIKSRLVIIDAKERFLAELKGVTDPEVKRKRIGKLYVDIFQEEAGRHRDVAFLGQGTIYSDVIESKGSKHASHIKSHHNVGGLPAGMKLILLEPVRNFYKDEVREIGKKSGLPKEITSEQPFPGPGYAVRVRGEVTKERLESVQKADLIVVEEMKRAKLYDKIFQCFAVMTGAFSTAVKGDGRVFAEVVGVRAYESVDIMTSSWANIPYNVLATISSRIVNEVPNISRVVYDITTKPPATMEWE